MGMHWLYEVSNTRETRVTKGGKGFRTFILSLVLEPEELTYSFKIKALYSPIAFLQWQFEFIISSVFTQDMIYNFFHPRGILVLSEIQLPFCEHGSIYLGAILLSLYGLVFFCEHLISLCLLDTLGRLDLSRTIYALFDSMCVDFWDSKIYIR